MNGQLLAKGHSVTETAEASGFDDPNYFSRIFKRKYGESPSEMQKLACETPHLPA